MFGPKKIFTGVATKGVMMLKGSLGKSNPMAEGVYFTFSKSIAKQYAGGSGEVLEFDLEDLQRCYTVQYLSYSGDYKIDEDVDLTRVPPLARHQD
jgi:hypothetical protein